MYHSAAKPARSPRRPRRQKASAAGLRNRRCLRGAGRPRVRRLRGRRRRIGIGRRRTSLARSRRSGSFRLRRWRGRRLRRWCRLGRRCLDDRLRLGLLLGEDFRLDQVSPSEQSRKDQPRTPSKPFVRLRGAHEARIRQAAGQQRSFLKASRATKSAFLITVSLPRERSTMVAGEVGS
jgi:hypothetical protein